MHANAVFTDVIWCFFGALVPRTAPLGTRHVPPTPGSPLPYQKSVSSLFSAIQERIPTVKVFLFMGMRYPGIEKKGVNNSLVGGLGRLRDGYFDHGNRVVRDGVIFGNGGRGRSGWLSVGCRVGGIDMAPAVRLIALRAEGVAVGVPHPNKLGRGSPIGGGLTS